MRGDPLQALVERVKRCILLEQIPFAGQMNLTHRFLDAEFGLKAVDDLYGPSKAFPFRIVKSFAKGTTKIGFPTITPFSVVSCRLIQCRKRISYSKCIHRSP